MNLSPISRHCPMLSQHFQDSTWVNGSQRRTLFDSYTSEHSLLDTIVIAPFFLLYTIISFLLKLCPVELPGLLVFVFRLFKAGIIHANMISSFERRMKYIFICGRYLSQIELT